ncbi:MAG: DUF4159 domain-containing protein [Planctomycetes bacterium]|nr:DUF4159 domain-containing protein [Planctomycetota bacterium]
MRKRAITFLFVLIAFSGLIIDKNSTMTKSIKAQDDKNSKDVKLPEGIGPWGKQRKANPHRRSAGESFPPLPLPATPLRRTERKRQPAPPVLIYKMRWGLKRKKTVEGKSFEWEDWNLGPADVQSLVKRANQVLKIRYKDQSLSFNNLKPDPVAFPILYFHGNQAIQSKIYSLTEAQKKALKEYIQGGGTVWFDAAYGSKTFIESVKALMKELLPERSFHLIAPDHPIFHSHYEIKEVKYASPIKIGEKELKTGPAMLEHIMIGTRSAVILSPICLAQGWDYTYTTGDCVHMVDAQKLGINMISYALAYQPLAKYLAAERVYHEQEEETGDFTFGIIETNGYWNTIPSGPANLLKILKENTRGRFMLQKKTVKLAKDNLSELPFLYLSGLGEFSFSDAEVKKLKEFLQKGGFLFVDNTDGNLNFQKAFRREIKKILPDNELTQIKPEHPIFSVFKPITKVKYTPRTVKLYPTLGNSPYLEGIELNNRICVIYSPFDLGGGWEGVGHPWTLAYSKSDAIDISINIILYSLTH